MKISRIIIIIAVIAIFILPLVMRINRKAHLVNTGHDTITNVNPNAEITSSVPSAIHVDSLAKTSPAKSNVLPDQNIHENTDTLKSNNVKANQSRKMIFATFFAALIAILLIWIVKVLLKRNRYAYSGKNNQYIDKKDSAFSNPSYSTKVETGMEFLQSESLREEIERAKKARDQANTDKWIREGSQGLGQTHLCQICNKVAYGEATIIRLQKEALAQSNMFKAQTIDQQTGYRCKSCGKEYCKDCLEKKAPGNAFGGKSCPNCNGLFEIIHG